MLTESVCNVKKKLKKGLGEMILDAFRDSGVVVWRTGNVTPPTVSRLDSWPPEKYLFALRQPDPRLAYSRSASSIWLGDPATLWPEELSQCMEDNKSQARDLFPRGIRLGCIDH